jgi:hypothetical protein
VAANASVEVADILKTKIADERDRRRVQRQFDQLEEAVADRIVAVLGHEFRGLDQGERTAAVWAAREVLGRARLTDSDLFDADLDPIYLERHIRKGMRKVTRDLSEVGVALYDRLLAECCTDIVELTTALPEFGPAAFTEILRRETKLIEMVRELLDRVPAREVGGRRDAADAEFAAAYRAQVVNRLDRLKLFGVTQATQRYPLSVAYVSLNVVTSSVAGNDGTQRSGAQFGSSHPDEEPRGSDGPVRVEGALSQGSRLLIRGEAGSGKTTLLQWLAVRSARYDFDEPLDRWNALVPFFIQLRNYIDHDLPEPAEFVRQIGRHLADKMPHGWVNDLLAGGLAVVLIDGVDELPAKQRVAARRWLGTLTEDFPNARYIVTSRPAAIGADWLESDGFLATSLEPMSPADVTGFVCKWHEAVRSDIVDSAEFAELGRCERKLLGVLAQARHLRQLATNPLMCALLCALHRDRRTQLPHDRIEIYDAALETLLERRDAERGVAGEIRGLSRRRKMIILQALAYWLVRNDWSDAPRDRAVDQVQRCLATMPDVRSEPPIVLQSLLERSGVLREPVVGRVDFVHRTFQEYLAARAVVDAGDLGVLLQHAHDDLWQEVVVLAVGYAGVAAREELLSGLLKLAETAPRDKRNRLHLVALACLEAAPQVSAQPRREIEKEAARLLPPTTMAQAEAVAKAGEFGLELLISNPVRTAKQAAATIRAASLIGGDRALRLIASCSKPATTKAVSEELLRAWARFDPEIYARDVLAGAPFYDIEINDPARLRVLHHLKLHSLQLYIPKGYGDLSSIGCQPNLTYLSIRDKLLTNLAPLWECPNLESLELWETGRIDLGELQGCAKLTKLDFDYRSAIEPARLSLLNQLDNIQIQSISSFEPIARIIPEQSRLRRFGLWEARELSNLSTMLRDHRLSQLDFLLLGECTNLHTIAGIEAWSDTMSGIFLHAPKLRNLQIIGELTKLDFANIALCPIRDLSFIANLSGVRILHLGGAGPLPDLEPLCALGQLSHLYLYGYDDIDLSPLAGKEGLRVIVDNAGNRNIQGAERLATGSTVVRRLYFPPPGDVACRFGGVAPPCGRTSPQHRELKVFRAGGGAINLPPPASR